MNDLKRNNTPIIVAGFLGLGLIALGWRAMDMRSEMLQLREQLYDINIKIERIVDIVFPDYDGECEPEVVSYEDAMELMTEYISDSEGLSNPDDLYKKYPLGDNIDECLQLAIRKTRDIEETYGDYKNLRFRYGLEEGKDRDTDRLAILLPLDTRGREVSLSTDTRVVMINLPTNFQDPCPPLCD